MDDQKIIDLYWSWSETAITETDRSMANTATPLPITSLQTTKMPKKV